MGKKRGPYHKYTKEEKQFIRDSKKIGKPNIQTTKELNKNYHTIRLMKETISKYFQIRSILLNELLELSNVNQKRIAARAFELFNNPSLILNNAIEKFQLDNTQKLDINPRNKSIIGHVVDAYKNIKQIKPKSRTKDQKHQEYDVIQVELVTVDDNPQSQPRKQPRFEKQEDEEMAMIKYTATESNQQQSEEVNINFVQQDPSVIADDIDYNLQLEEELVKRKLSWEDQDQEQQQKLLFTE